MFAVIQRYYPPASEHQRFREVELVLIVQQWLRDLTLGEIHPHFPGYEELARVGFTEALRGAVIDVLPIH